MRRIKVGDKVRAFLDSRICGSVIDIEQNNSAPWMVGGTAAPEKICILELADGKKIRYKMSELHHDE